MRARRREGGGGGGSHLQIYLVIVKADTDMVLCSCTRAIFRAVPVKDIKTRIFFKKKEVVESACKATRNAVVADAKTWSDELKPVSKFLNSDHLTCLLCCC